MKNKLSTLHDIVLNFSSNHENYYGAWLYTTKQDDNYLESPGHQDLRSVTQP